ncbi:MAG: N-formylglutamate amidohydrolase [Vicinamibacterales bacterium]
MDAPLYPGWVVLHVPHDSVVIPPAVRDQFVLDDQALATELVRMTDHRTLEIFAHRRSSATIVRAEVSRLVVDVERFPDDEVEPMAARGMGAVYSATSHLQQLRRPLHGDEREALMRTYYMPHHTRLEAAVSDALARYGACLVLDCHSFAGTALPYEMAAAERARPDICIGTDAFHTPPALAEAFAESFGRESWSVALNDPFSGALVPSGRYLLDQRISAVMVEVNRRLYIDEATSTPLTNFAEVARRIRRYCATAIER